MTAPLAAVPEEPEDRSGPPGEGTFDQWLSFLLTQRSSEVIEGVFDGDGTAIVGQPYAGKTTLAQGIALYLVTGCKEFLGRPVAPGPHRVFYVATDPGGPARVAEQFHKMGLPATASLSLGPLPGGASDKKAWDDWFRARQDDGTTIVIFDNLLGMAREGEDFDRTSGALPILSILRRCREAGMAVLAVAHPPKNHQGVTALGSQAFEAFFRRRINYDGEGDAPRRLRIVSNSYHPLEGTVVLGRNGLPEIQGELLRSRSDERTKRYGEADLRNVAESILNGPDGARASVNAGGNFLTAQGVSQSASAGGRMIRRAARMGHLRLEKIAGRDVIFPPA